MVLGCYFYNPSPDTSAGMYTANGKDGWTCGDQQSNNTDIGALSTLIMNPEKKGYIPIVAITCRGCSSLKSKKKLKKGCKKAIIS